MGGIVECMFGSLRFPARVTRRLADSLEVTMLAGSGGGTFEISKSFVRNVAYRDGDPILAVTEGLECHAWFAYDGSYHAAVVSGQEADDTAMVTYADCYRPEEVPVAYLRTSASIEAMLVFRRPRV